MGHTMYLRQETNFLNFFVENILKKLTNQNNQFSRSITKTLIKSKL